MISCLKSKYEKDIEFVKLSDRNVNFLENEKKYYSSKNNVC